MDLALSMFLPTGRGAGGLADEGGAGGSEGVTGMLRTSLVFALGVQLQPREKMLHNPGP